MDFSRFIRCTWLLLLTITIADINANEHVTQVTVTVDKDGAVIGEKARLSNPEQIAEPINKSMEANGESNTAAATQESQIEIMEMDVNEDEVKNVMALHDEIEKEAAVTQLDDNTEHMSRAVVDDSMLSDKVTNKIMQMIAFPTESNRNEGDAEQASTTNADAEPIAHNQEGVSAVVVEPRNSGGRDSRALRSRGDYYILALTPIQGLDAVPKHSKLDIIPKERALDGDLAVRKASKKHSNQSTLQSSSDVDEARILSKKMFNRYIRRLMKQIRKGTRKIQRKTHFKFKSNAPEPTVENFLRKLYTQQTTQNKKKKKTSWFSW